MTTEKAVKVIDYRETFPMKVVEFLLSKGFNQANFVGQAAEFYPAAGMGVLYKDPDVKPRKYLFGLITRAPRRSYIGKIVFANKPCEHWLFTVYGRKYVELATKLAEEMSTTFGVEIVVYLEHENPWFEQYSYEVD